ncbi:MAG TPA: hypothetical protein VGN49_09775, partial [Micrococcaceae bacterium]|nr:hypothetical protein [Micrococcaceae bacterium]
MEDQLGQDSPDTGTEATESGATVPAAAESGATVPAAVESGAIVPLAAVVVVPDPSAARGIPAEFFRRLVD